MDQRTYELIAQFITEKTGIRIELHQDICPHAEIETKTIRLPLNIEDDNVFAALAVTMHEAGHLQHTPLKMRDLSDDIPEKFEIVNAFEDVRVDRKNFQELPNIRGFYEKLYKHTEERSRTDWKNVPLPLRVLAVLNLRGVGFKHLLEFKDQEVSSFIKQHGLEQDLLGFLSNAERLEDNPKDEGAFSDLKQTVDKVFKILYPNFKQNKKKGNSNGQGQDGESGETGESSEQDANESGKGKQQNSKDNQKNGGHGQGDGDTESQDSSEGIEQQSRVDKLLKRGLKEIFKTSKFPSKKVATKWVGQVALEQQTKQRFSDLLNEKCVKHIDDGSSLDTNSLTSFFTGDIETLFKEEKIITRKHSKVILVLDASGSMSSSLIDNKCRKEVVLKTARALDSILKEVCDQEGANVEYEVSAFCESFHRLKQNEWESHYESIGGGTDILNAFNEASKILNAPDVDGERLMVLITDGDVSEGEIKEMKKRVIQEGTNLKAIIVGVGADISGSFVQSIIGSNNILAEKHANIILMEAIMELLN